MQCVICSHVNPVSAKFCSACGSSLDVNQTTGRVYTPFLAKGLRLQNGAFVVGDVLGQGGFGITYKGGDLFLRRYVAIKELFPQGSVRQSNTLVPDHNLTSADYDGMKSAFLEEAQNLGRFTHPSIVRVFTAFEENNTAYMVMEFLEGGSLSGPIAQNGRLEEGEVVRIAVTIGEALSAVHEAGMIHRDVKPDNIMQTRDGRVVLIDFGIARSFALDKTVTHTTMLTAGYAPLEQYGKRARFGPYTDIYALAATLYHALTGEVPPAATDLASGVELKSPATLNPRVSRAVSEAIMQAMSRQTDERPQTVRDFLQLLQKQTPVVPGNVSSPASSPAPESTESAPLKSIPSTPQRSGIALSIDEINAILTGSRGNDNREVNDVRMVFTSTAPFKNVVSTLMGNLKSGARLIRYHLEEKSFTASALAGKTARVAEHLLVFKVEVLSAVVDLTEYHHSKIQILGYCKGRWELDVVKNVTIPLFLNNLGQLGQGGSPFRYQQTFDFAAKQEKDEAVQPALPLELSEVEHILEELMIRFNLSKNQKIHTFKKAFKRKGSMRKSFNDIISKLKKNEHGAIINAGTSEEGFVINGAIIKGPYNPIKHLKGEWYYPALVTVMIRQEKNESYMVDVMVYSKGSSREAQMSFYSTLSNAI